MGVQTCARPNYVVEIGEAATAQTLGARLDVEQLDGIVGAEIDIVIEGFEDRHLLGLEQEQQPRQDGAGHAAPAVGIVGRGGADYAFRRFTGEGHARLLDAVAGVVLQPLETRGLADRRSEEHTSELQSLMRISYAVFCLKKKKNNMTTTNTITHHKEYTHITP